MTLTGDFRDLQRQVTFEDKDFKILISQEREPKPKFICASIPSDVLNACCVLGTGVSAGGPMGKHTCTPHSHGDRVVSRGDGG